MPWEAKSELARLEELRRYQLLDTPPEAAFDDLVQLAAHICEAPVALVSLVDEHRQWFKARVGLEVCETSREVAFCAHAIRSSGPFIVADAAQDERFARNPLVTGEPRIRFYAGMPLVSAKGHALGTLCVIDHRPRALPPEKLDMLARLARQVTAQIELRLANRLLREEALFRENLRACLAHDLRSPLSAIRLGSDQLIRPELPKRVRDCGALVSRSADRMARLISDLLDFEHAKHEGTMPIGLEPCDAMETCRQVVSEFSTARPDREIRLSSRGEARGRWDAGRLGQVVSNLVANALAHGDRAGVVGVEVDGTLLDEVALHVRNRGEPIPAAEIPALFEPYRRGRRAQGGGLGLGLFIVRTIVQAHQGRIDVESSPEQGTVFSVRLPRSMDVARD